MVRSCFGVLYSSLAVLVAGPAGAVDQRVKDACRQDYFNHCSSFAVGSEELRACMRKVDKDLSPACIDALVAAGEVSAKEVERRRAAAH
jgi:adenylate kinase